MSASKATVFNIFNVLINFVTDIDMELFVSHSLMPYFKYYTKIRSVLLVTCDL